MAEANPAPQSAAFFTLLKLITQKPHLLVAHAEAYSGLIGQEFSNALGTWRNRFFLGAAALFLFIIACILAGTSILLWATTPATEIHSLWLLWIIPIAPLALACICLLFNLNALKRSVFMDVRKQLQDDMALLRDMSAPSP